ncbi:MULTISPECIES: VanZ family protein [unclassified Knoellia]|uniref:VanZ family protein n=1 Tax=Knoellia altitudinis TaxID=3404795 RepID=UPI003614C2CA
MRSERTPRWTFAPVLAALLLQLGVLYAPSGGGAPPFAHFDKLVHCAVFALPVFLALLVRLPFTPVVIALAAHAPVSEIVQATLLPKRAGDPWDVVADLVGVCLGVAAAHLGLRRAKRDR